MTMLGIPGQAANDNVCNAIKGIPGHPRQARTSARTSAGNDNSCAIYTVTFCQALLDRASPSGFTKKRYPLEGENDITRLLI